MTSKKFFLHNEYSLVAKKIYVLYNSIMAIITALERQKKDNSRISVFIDGEFFAGADEFTVARLRLKVGEEVNREELDNFIRERDCQKAFDAACRYLSSRPHAKKEVRDYLARKEYGEGVIEDVLNKLSGYGYINDELFAAEYVRSYRTSRGKKVMAYELKKLDVDDEIIDRVTDIDQSAEIAALAEKYRRTHKNSDDRKTEVYLASKGFSREEIRAAVSEDKDVW